MTRRLRSLAFALAASSFATACSPSAQVAGIGGRHPWTEPGVLRIGSADEPDSLNPLFSNSDAADQISALIFAPIFRYDERGEFVPELATEVPTYANGGISADSKTIVLHWRKGVKWSDGAPLGPSDLRFTWRAVMNPKNNAKSSIGWDDISAIDVPNDATAIVRLKKPNADVLGLFGMGGSAYPPLPEHLLGNEPSLNTSAFNAHPISSGPWLLRAWNHGSSLEFAPNTRYWRGAPKLTALSFRIVPNPDTLVAQLQTHEIDLDASVSETQLARVRTIPGLRIVRHPSANWRHLDMNCSRPGLADPRVRRAIAESIDWDRLNATVYHGANLRAASDIPPDSWAAPHIPFYPFDPRGAAASLQAAGYVPGPGGIRSNGKVTLAFTISATNKPGNAEAEVTMQQQLRAIGIGLTIKNLPAGTLFAENGPLYGGTYDLEWSIETNGPDPDNQGLWSTAFIPPHGANTSFLRDPEITKLSADAVSTFDRKIRKGLYQKEETRIHELAPAVFFYWQTTTAAYDDDLHGYRPAEYYTDNWNSWEWSI
jgi:peptide/nickel transport system substrate-binding protein